MSKGGTRKGAGRPAKPLKEKYQVKAISLPPQCWQWIDQQGGSRGSVVRWLVGEKMAKRNGIGVKV